MKTAVALALTALLSPAYADSLTAYLTNLQITGVSDWGDLTGAIDLRTAAYGEDFEGLSQPLHGLSGTQSLSWNGMTATKGADGSAFVVTGASDRPGVRYYGEVTLRSDLAGEPIRIAPGAQVTLTADIGFDTVISPGSLGTAKVELGWMVRQSLDPASPNIQTMGGSSHNIPSSSISYSSPTGITFLNDSSSWQYGSVLVRVSIDGTVAPIPEPATHALMLGGLGTLGLVARRQRAVTHGARRRPLSEQA